MTLKDFLHRFLRQDVTAQILDAELASVLQCERCNIYIADEQNQYLVPKICRLDSQKTPINDRSIVGFCAMNKKVQNIVDASKAHRFDKEREIDQILAR